MKIERYIPNLFTMGNLFCGFAGLIVTISGDIVSGAVLVFAGAGFDLFDGMLARLLKVHSETGKELDSLADVVTFGALPASIIYELLMATHNEIVYNNLFGLIPLPILLAFTLLASAAWRLAVFNTKQSNDEGFTGLPSPAAGMFIASLPLIIQYNDLTLLSLGVSYLSVYILNAYVLTGIAVLISWLMISRVKMFSLKMKSLSFVENKLVYFMAIFSVGLFAWIVWAAIPLILIIYLILSLITQRKNEVQSTD